MMKSLNPWLERLYRQWYQQLTWGVMLWPLMCLYRFGYHVIQWRKQSPWTCDVPILCVGNITVGGGGKSPLVTWLAKYLAHQGVHVAVVMRGYGRQNNQVILVQAHHSPAEVGDEACVLRQQANVDIWVGDRLAAIKRASKKASCIICDDGLQDKRIAYDGVLIAKKNGRGWGNGYCLPMGPLRQPWRQDLGDVVDVGGAYGSPWFGTVLPTDCQRSSGHAMCASG